MLSNSSSVFFFIERMQNDFGYLVYGAETRARRRISRNDARANTRMEFHLDSLKIIFGPIFRNCCLLSCRCTRSAYADQTAKRFASFRDSERLSRPSVFSSSPSPLSILSEPERYRTVKRLSYVNDFPNARMS